MADIKLTAIEQAAVTALTMDYLRNKGWDPKTTLDSLKKQGVKIQPATITRLIKKGLIKPIDETIYKGTAVKYAPIRRGEKWAEVVKGLGLPNPQAEPITIHLKL